MLPEQTIEDEMMLPLLLWMAAENGIATKVENGGRILQQRQTTDRHKRCTTLQQLGDGWR
jgi:hypothetical protein